ncbi:Phenylalanine ammonia-lyase [Serendipita indica DSM 11827]|nr:Phenylalanine ammonia-lyase [Serendipita indica DSM 11827]
MSFPVDNSSLGRSAIHRESSRKPGSSSQHRELDTPGTFVDAFLTIHDQIKAARTGSASRLDGHNLSIGAIVAVARHGAPVRLDDSRKVKEKVAKSRQVMEDLLKSHISVYGVSTGFGGSADTRTKAYDTLGRALLQHQSSGVISVNPPSSLPLNHAAATTIMPESWVRAAMLVRCNSLVRGHSAVRWEILEALTNFLQHGITPVVPLRGSISASGDLSPLSYVALAINGNPAIGVYSGTGAKRRIVPAPQAIEEAGIKATTLAPKEQLGLLNGTAFSSAAASLALAEATQLAVLAQVCTAMGTEALLGTRGSYVPFIHETARPHPGQVEVAQVVTRLLDGSRFATEAYEEVKTVDQDQNQLRQDRYALRTSPQFIGPQIEDLLHAIHAVTQECNSTTDNPLVNGENGHVYHGGNFQAMSVTNAMEKTRLALHHLGRIIFAQVSELVNPAMNRGLPPSLAATDPSVNYHAKGLDIASAAYVSELGYLANPVSTHIQSAELHNQSVNSLALISARVTINSTEVLSMLVAHSKLSISSMSGTRFAYDATGVQDEPQRPTGQPVEPASLEMAEESRGRRASKVTNVVNESLDKTTTMDAVARMKVVADHVAAPLMDALGLSMTTDAIKAIHHIREEFAVKSAELLQSLRHQYLDGSRGQTPASQYMGKTKDIYEFIRRDLGVKMHGIENLMSFEGGMHSTGRSIGQNVTRIYEAIRDGEMYDILANLVAMPRQRDGLAFAKL